jgi:hypothetical protein
VRGGQLPDHGSPRPLPPQPPFTFSQPKTPSIPGAFSGLIGDPTAQGHGGSTITFQSGSAGSYQYICPMPGHAQMGMHGAFTVR